MSSTGTYYRFIKRFLLHTIIIWLLINVGNWLFYQYKIWFKLASTVHTDGSLVSAKEQFINHNFHQSLICWVLLVAFLAETNLFLFLRKKRLLGLIASSICLGILGSAISLLFAASVDVYSRAAQFLETIVAITTYIISYIIAYNFFYERYQHAKARQKQSESELHLLKSQIDPHFFFNSLNNLYGMALNENAHETANGIDLLAEMMRYNMNGMSEKYSSLEVEFTFINNYIALQRLRVPEKANIKIAIHIDHPGMAYKIAPMLLIPLIENAWKYGVSIDRVCYIILNISLVSNKLTMVIANSIFPERYPPQSTGIGLKNVKQRLELLYPNRYQYLIKKDEANYQATLTIAL